MTVAADVWVFVWGPVSHLPATPFLKPEGEAGVVREETHIKRERADAQQSERLDPRGPQRPPKPPPHSRQTAFAVFRKSRPGHILASHELR